MMALILLGAVQFPADMHTDSAVMVCWAYLSQPQPQSARDTEIRKVCGRLLELMNAPIPIPLQPSNTPKAQQLETLPSAKEGQ